MNLIAKITNKDFNLPEKKSDNTEKRFASRGIITNSSGEIALFNKKNKNEYKLPGGGIEENEKPEEGLVREIMEETGCEIEQVQLLGYTIEERNNSNFTQTSYIYTAKVLRDTGRLRLTKKEKDEGGQIIWVPLEETIKLIENSINNLKASEYENLYHTKFIVLRDLSILKYYMNGQTKERAQRNRTIVLSLQETQKYFGNCITLSKKELSAENVINSTIVGDMLKTAKCLPDKFVDLLIADPPYNLGKIYNGTNFKKMDEEKYKEYTREWISAIVHTLKENASIYICCDWQTSILISQVLPEFFLIQNRITWQREKGRGALSNWKNGMEDIWFATMSKVYTFNVDAVKVRRKVLAPYRTDGKPKDWEETEDGNFRDTFPSNFWDDISIPYWSMPENTDHPTQKPEKLIAKLILASSNEQNVVLDPFLGSGTTSVAAKKLNRKYVGIELEKEYCALAEKRLESAETDKEIQGFSKGVFWERNSSKFQKK